MMFYSEPRTWKWAVPGFVFFLLLWVSIILTGMQEKNWSVGTMLFGLLALAIALSNYWKWLTNHRERIFEQHQSALSTTPLVLLANNMKQMHPEAIRVLERFGVRTSWQVRVDVKRNMRTWILEGTNPNVHFGFIEFVLSRSGKTLYPKNRFAEGSKKWDPDGVVTDREQYAEFEMWLFARLMVTRSHGDYKPAEFIPPWTPALILETMGLTGEQDLYQPDDEKVVKELAPLSASTQTAPQMPTMSGGNLEEKRDVRELNDEEFAAIEAEYERYARLYADGKIPG